MARTRLRTDLHVIAAAMDDFEVQYVRVYEILEVR